MAAGRLAPFSRIPATAGRVFPRVHVGATNGKMDEGMGVQASVGADSTWELRFAMPMSIPSGTLKLELLALANATSGNAKVNPKWVAISAAGGNPDTASRVAEGTTTITWGAGDNDDYKQTKITLDATTLPAAGEILVMDLVFETSSWTLAQISTWQAFLIWE